nr:hypothetical protein [Mycobacterium sp. PS03-16]
MASAPDEIGDAHNEVMTAQLRKWMPDRAPIWTETGVTALGAPKMRVEIRVTAIVGDCELPGNEPRRSCA